MKKTVSIFTFLLACTSMGFSSFLLSWVLRNHGLQSYMDPLVRSWYISQSYTIFWIFSVILSGIFLYKTFQKRRHFPIGGYVLSIFATLLWIFFGSWIFLVV